MDAELRRLEREARDAGSLEAREGLVRARQRSTGVDALLERAVALLIQQARLQVPAAEAVVLSEAAWLHARKGDASLAKSLACEALPDGAGAGSSGTTGERLLRARTEIRAGAALACVGAGGWEPLVHGIETLRSCDELPFERTLALACTSVADLRANGAFAPPGVLQTLLECLRGLRAASQLEVVAAAQTAIASLFDPAALAGLGEGWLSRATLLEQRGQFRSFLDLPRHVERSIVGLRALHGGVPPAAVRVAWEALLEQAGSDDDRYPGQELEDAVRAVERLERALAVVLESWGAEATARADELRAAYRLDTIEAPAVLMALARTHHARGALAEAQAVLRRAAEESDAAEDPDAVSLLRGLCRLALEVPLPAGGVELLQRAHGRLAAAGELEEGLGPPLVRLLARVDRATEAEALVEEARARVAGREFAFARANVLLPAHLALVQEAGRAGWSEAARIVDRAASTADELLTELGGDMAPQSYVQAARAEALRVHLACAAARWAHGDQQGAAKGLEAGIENLVASQRGWPLIPEILACFADPFAELPEGLHRPAAALLLAGLPGDRDGVEGTRPDELLGALLLLARGLAQDERSPDR